MELESLKRQIDYLEQNDVNITKLVTDRHIQVGSYMAKEKPEIEHAYDVWHIAKGTLTIENCFQLFCGSENCFMCSGEKKKLNKLVKQKKFKPLKPWIPVSMLLNLYF